jgi:CheY-like chemotaxis protein
MKNGVRVLVVEDDEDDFFLTQRALRKFTAGPIFHVESGRAAIEYLGGQGRYADRAEFPLPDIVFLDLKMDQVSGHQVLQWVRNNLGEAAPKIFVLTGSNEPRDRDFVKNSGAATGYIVKPLSPEHLRTIFPEGQ